MQRILRSTPATIEARFYPSGSETLTSDGTVTVSVTRADGTVVAGVSAVTELPPGVYKATLPVQANLDLLTATWTGTTQTVTTQVEIVGGFYVSLAEIRAEKNLADSTKFPTADLETARAWFEDIAEDYCNVAFVPRYGREALDGTAGWCLRLRYPNQNSRSFRDPLHLRRVLAATIDGTAVSAPVVANWDLYEDGRINAWDAGTTFGIGRRNIVVAYEYGYDAAPEQLRRAALTAIRYRLLTDESQQIPDRATSLVNEFGNIVLSQPGEKRATGIPEVDAVLERLSERTPGIA